MDDTTSRDIVLEFVTEPCTGSNGDTNSIFATVTMETRPQIKIKKHT